MVRYGSLVVAVVPELRGAVFRSYPPKQEEVAATKLAPVGPKKRVENPLQCVPCAYTSKVD